MITTRHQRTVIEAPVREAIVARHYDGTTPDPEAGTVPRLVALTTHLYAPDAVDDETGRPFVCARTLASLEDRLAQFHSKNYKGEDLLREYRDRVDPTFEWSPYRMRNKCRTATQFDCDPDLVLLARAPRTSDPAVLVYAADGTPVTSDSRAGDLDEARAGAFARSGCHFDHRVPIVLDYLNSLPSNRYTSAVNLYHQRAVARAEKLLASDEITGVQHSVALASMAALVAQPTPVYALSRRERSQRLFPVNQGLLTLSSTLSKEYRADWATYDLVSSQSAINAVDWGADKVTSFLERHIGTPGALWAHLAAAVGKDIAEVKGPIKEAFYSLQFGKDIDAIVVGLDGSVGAGAGEAFTDDRLVRDFAEARNRWYRQIKGARGLEGAFGEWIPLGRGRDAASLAAERSQGVEFLLLYPAVELAMSTDRWDIVLWQHDGFDVAFRDKSRWLQTGRQICAAVDDECRRRGYPTRLVLDRSPDGGDTDRHARVPYKARSQRLGRGCRV